MYSKSKHIFTHAKKNIAGGANSTMRALPYQIPLIIKKAEGAKIWDVDGNELIDMNMAYGSLIFGHRPRVILNAIRDELERRGTTLGFPHELSHLAAELIKKSFPSIDKLRFSSTGTEVVQTAVRLARAYTKRTHIVLFEGHYHGSADSVFHKYHASIEELDEIGFYSSLSGTDGMGDAPYNAFVIPWNNIDILKKILSEKGSIIAAVIMEPIMGNAGVIPPEPGFLEQVRASTSKYNIVLIFDEVITGFRVSRGGAQERYGVQSDITTLSKAMNGGIPISAIGGRKDIMEFLAENRVFHGGVYSGNPLCVAATLALQKEYKRRGKEIYDQLESYSNRLCKGLKAIFKAVAIPIVVQNAGAMVSLAFVNRDDIDSIKSYRELRKTVMPSFYVQFQHSLQNEGVFIHPNCFEPWYVSIAHTEDIIDMVLEKVEKAAKGFV